ncbi:mercuric transporter MerT family protein [Methylobacterium isbiliense]|uniref:Mercuric transport protein MerT n=1 Tax=Methylobacterium isbiliense TaxID=315478 RepID=A0ABQ4SLQ8_9HYPH|nr:mercuric transporter MerT family protein [Methylobacterium isbiliense]MDN3627896.1 mercuric transporter MerT family protein [Methylobacterium isbiliense]GJE02705.1 Mercuric transport protein MerT [Methylobacterium isbiliense]
MRAFAPERVQDQVGLETSPRRTSGLLAIGGVLAALGASSCCILPFLLFTLGISGAWISNLTALAPYQPLFILAAVGLLASGFVRVYRSPKAACAEGSYCANPSSSRIAKIGLWTAAVLVTIATAFPYLAPFLLEI